MPRDNQIVTDDVQRNYYCLACNRGFINKGAVLAHCRSASFHTGEWCERCEWLFVSPAARTSHSRESLRHWECHICKRYDFPDKNLLAEHLGNEHSVCCDCRIVVQSYLEHRYAVHHRCRDCQTEFSNSNDLRMVGLLAEVFRKMFQLTRR